jgi:hypothetical protein
MKQNTSKGAHGREFISRSLAHSSARLKGVLIPSFIEGSLLVALNIYRRIMLGHDLLEVTRLDVQNDDALCVSDRPSAVRVPVCI